MNRSHSRISSNNLNNNQKVKSTTSYGTVTAAAATTVPTPPPPTDLKNLKEINRTHNGEIKRESQLYCKSTDSGKICLYTATKNVCEKCKSKDASSRHPPPRCYAGQCKICGLYGHNTSDCHHELSRNAKKDGVSTNLSSPN